MPIEQNVPISFPGLNLVFNVSNIAFSIGSMQIHWYLILIAIGIVFALTLAIIIRTNKVHNIAFTIGKFEVRFLSVIIAIGVLFALICALFVFVLDLNNIILTTSEIQIRWYGILIASGLLLALFYSVKRLKDFKVTFDDLTDVVLISTIFAIIGARLYYCVFFVDGVGAHPYLSSADGIKSILYIWDGGLAFYGAVIFALIAAFITCKIKKINPLPFLDIAGLGFLIGQGIGRWGNFFNREAYGSVTTLPWRMVFDFSSNASGIGFHPCFLYESLWCALGFVLLHFYSKHRKFNGELFLMFLAWNGLGRFFIEGLRTDSLWIIKDVLKVSQLLAAVMFVVSIGLIIFIRVYKKNKANSQEYVPVYGELNSEENKDQNVETLNNDEHKTDTTIEDNEENSKKIDNENTDEQKDKNKSDD
jgi:phosphatidylglycerol:prolipoprotein diacylglycerol transferase